MNPTFDFDVKFQEAIIRLLHQEPPFAEAALPFLEHVLFENPVHVWTVKTMRRHYTVNKELADLNVLRNEQLKAQSLGTIRKEDAAAYKVFLLKKIKRPVKNANYIKRELQQFIKHQALKNFILEAVDSHLPKRAFDVIDKKLTEYLHVDVTGDFSMGERPGETYLKRIKDRRLPTEAGITTGIAELDKLMTGNGCKPKQLGTVIAPTGRGKTNFLINLAASAVMDDVPTLYVTLELDARTIMDRMDARFTEVPLRHLLDNEVEVKAAYAKIRNRVKRNLVVKEFPPGSTTVGTLTTFIKLLEREGFSPRLIVIDYADLLKPRIEFADSSYETQGQIYLDILQMLAELKLVGWTATQGNRKSMTTDAKGDVDLSMMADSMKKAMLAYVVLGIAQNEKEKKFKKGRIMVLKNRNGPSDRTLKVSIEHDTVKFRSIT